MPLRLETVGEALAFLEETSGGIPWDEALYAARLSIVQATMTGSASDITEATTKLERYLGLSSSYNFGRFRRGLYVFLNA